MSAVGLRIVFKAAQVAKNVKAAHAGRLMMWSGAHGAVAPDGQLAMQHSGAAGGFNLSRFHLPAMDVLHERLQALPGGPERLQVFDQAKRLAVAYMPEKTLVHRVSSQLMQPWLVGYRAPLFGNKWFHLVDLDMVALRAQCRGGRASSCRGGSSIADV